MRKIINKSIYIYLILILFYGILIKFTKGNTFLFSLKTILPEMMLVLINLYCIFILILKKKVKKTRFFVDFMIFYFTSIIIINILKKPNINEINFIVRDVYLPLFTMYFLTKINFNDTEVDNIFSGIINIFIIFIISGFILAIIQRINGWEWTSKFYAGYKYYGMNEFIKVKIWESNNILRVPSLTGSSVSFGFYNLIATLFIINSNIKLKNKVFIIIASIGNIYLSNNKTCLIIISLILIYLGMRKINKKLRITFLIIMIISIVNCGVILLTSKPFLLYSFKERLRLWMELLQQQYISDYILPLNLFKYTGASSGIFSFLDNSFLFFILSTGILGFILIFINVIMSSKFVNYKYKMLINQLNIVFLFASVTTNIVQGRVLFNIYMIIIGVFCFNRELRKEVLK